uniref:Uncharacterized protein n=1 Tax=Anguilla anguilla TaxID=7936 RepID=A0A0E9UQX5_ANGAN
MSIFVRVGEMVIWLNPRTHSELRGISFVQLSKALRSLGRCWPAQSRKSR